MDKKFTQGGIVPKLQYSVDLAHGKDCGAEILFRIKQNGTREILRVRWYGSKR